jgi:hypothetical protein
MSSQFSSINCQLITINSQCLAIGMCFVKTELMILEMRSVENVLLISTPIHQTSPPCLWFQYKLFRQKSRCIYLFTRNENNLHALYSFSYWELYMHFHDLAFIAIIAQEFLSFLLINSHMHESWFAHSRQHLCTLINSRVLSTDTLIKHTLFKARFTL